MKFTTMSDKEKKETVMFVLETLEGSRNYYELRKKLKRFESIDNFKQILSDEAYGHKFKRALGMILDDVYKYSRNVKRFENQPKVVNQGTVYHSVSGESWIDWYIFDAGSEEEVLEIIASSDGYIYIEADRFHSDYDCTGRMFSHDMNIRKVAQNRWLATKWHGLDV